MTIEEVYNNKEISVRSYNVCRLNGIDSIEKLQHYYLTYQTFENLPNCGLKSSQELVEVYLKYQNYDINDNFNHNKIKNHLNQTLSHLTRVQREVINSFIYINTNNLSVRSKNAISIYLENNFSVKNFIEKILVNKSFRIENVENVGKKSIPELEIYISIIRDMIIEVSQSKDEKQFILLKNTFFIKELFSGFQIPNDILESELIFRLINFLLDNNALFDDNQSVIFKKGLKIYEGREKLTLDNIAIENNLTRERVRQIRKDCLESLFEKFSFVKNFDDDLLQNYGIDKSLNFININGKVLSRINSKNNTFFSSEFISYILSVYLDKNFILVGNIEDVLVHKFSNNRNRHNWNNFYIVNKDLSKVDYIAFANDIYERLNEKIEETYSFNFKSYLSRFINNMDIEIIELGFSAAEKILNDEFGLYLDLDDNIVFKRNTIKQAFEYSYEALEKLGKPSKVEEITQKIIELHPNYETDDNRVRVSMKRKDGFVPIGRTSVFGLKKWEKEIDDFKGGTIRSITVEFLEQFESPKHISLIANHVSNYREDTYQRSIVDNLKADKSNTFIFLKQGFIGLNNLVKFYDIEKYNNLPVQFGKTLISLSKKGYSSYNLKKYIISNYNLNEEEALAIINNLDSVK